jgi:glycogen(starch) synthase
MNILLPTDVFPPKCGGAGWSAHALALALIGRGHHVRALVPRRGARGLAHEDVLGVPALRRGYRAPPVPFLLNYFRHERLWPVLAADLVAMAAEGSNDSGRQLDALRRGPPAASQTPQATIIHAQHVQVTPAAVLAGERLGAPVVVTVRDHWPWDYFATGLHGDRVPHPRQSWASLATDLPARLGALRGSAALAAIPYMRAHLRRRQAFLRRADAVIAPSRYIARRLEQIVDPARIHVIPHMVDLGAIAQVIAQPPRNKGLEQPFLLYVGKLERNKGAHLLPEILAALQTAYKAGVERQETVPGRSQRLTLVVAGDGPLQGWLEAELGALGVRAHFLAWAEHDEVLRLMARCALLLYPSAWGEPLTRVLLEACACGAPVAAMPTGGTDDIIDHGVSGLLAATPEALGRQAAMLLARPDLRQELSQGASRAARERFAVERVVGRVEQLYQGLLDSAERHTRAT